METMREAWTDQRLDDLAARMDKGFERVDRDIREVRTEMNSRFNAVDSRFDAMQRTMILGFVTVIASGFASVIGSVVVTKL
jgi:hypothetical protein